MWLETFVLSTERMSSEKARQQNGFVVSKRVFDLSESPRSGRPSDFL